MVRTGIKKAGTVDLQRSQQCGKQDLNQECTVNSDKPCTILHNPVTKSDNSVQSHAPLINAGGGSGGGTKQSEL